MLIGDSDGKAVQFRVAALGKVEDVFMRVGEVTATVYGLDVADVDVFFEAVVVAVPSPINGNGLDPVYCVLEDRSGCGISWPSPKAPRDLWVWPLCSRIETRPARAHAELRTTILPANPDMLPCGSCRRRPPYLTPIL